MRYVRKNAGASHRHFLFLMGLCLLIEHIPVHLIGAESLLGMAHHLQDHAFVGTVECHQFPQGDVGGLRQRIRVGSRTLSIMISWSLENAVETADSMKSRGYSLPGRTAYSRYRWERRDTLSLIWLGLLGAGVAVLWARGALTFSFFPFFRGALWSGEALLGGGALGLLFLFPVLAEMWERAAWRRSGRALPAEK